jgi:hypothetical protein
VGNEREKLVDNDPSLTAKFIKFVFNISDGKFAFVKLNYGRRHVNHPCRADLWRGNWGKCQKGVS